MGTRQPAVRHRVLAPQFEDIDGEPYCDASCGDRVGTALEQQERALTGMLMPSGVHHHWSMSARIRRSFADPGASQRSRRASA